MARARSKFYKPGLLALAALLLLVVGLMQSRLNLERADPALGIRRAASLGRNAPPLLEFTTVALGGFRGLIANVLWIRANDLQNDGKYFEMVQLADWITKLEPTFVQVWVVQAWNMAYNISVKFSEPADRWRWVQRGIELLRDEGLRYNPKEALVYRELAWFFQHKMGHVMDDAHLYYKSAWAKEMTDLFGSGRPNFNELLDPKTDQARQRVALLRDKYKMDPALMKEADAHYGPLEWRLPETHAIYWAVAGLKNSKKKDLITLRRVIYQSMHMATLRGRIVLTQADGAVLLGPALEKVEKANAAYEQMIVEDDEKREAIKNAHKNFLRDVTYLLYTHNRLSEANRWFRALRQKYPDAIPANQTLDDYAIGRITEKVAETDVNRIKLILDGLLLQSYLSLAIDEEDHATGLMLLARKIRDYYEVKTAGQKGRIGLPDFDEMRRITLEAILDPETGYDPQIVARLRTKLNLPAPTNAPPSKG
jgi:hypothetical protein